MSKLQAVSPLYVLFKGENLRRFSGESQFLPPPDDAVVCFFA